jgi:phage gpG-like protein
MATRLHSIQAERMITIDTSQALAEIDAMLMRAHESAPFLEMVGEREVKAAQHRIRDTKLDPLGEAWAPWAPFTRSDRMHKGNTELGLLFDEGDLLLSIDKAIFGDTVEIGSNLDYAKDLQDGTDHMPAREFLGWSPDVLPIYENLYQRYIETGVI